VAKLLETISYVRCLVVDFSKAFDTINHVILAQKLDKLHLPDHVHNWIINFFTDRTQSVVLLGKLSKEQMITQSIIQGSGLGPVLYAIYSSDLKAIGKDTVLVKYADDTTLVYPDQTDVSFEDEFSNIKEWSKQNRLTINISKTKEIVFHRPNPQRFHAPAPLQDVQQVPSCRLLGTVISSSLSVRDPVDYILTVSSQHLYLLNKLKHAGLNLKALTVIFQAIVV